MVVNWHTLPESVSTALLKGGVGRLHRLSVAEAALHLAGGNTAGDAASCLPLAADLLRAAWEGDPLDARTAGQMLALDGAHPFLPVPVARFARHLAQAEAIPADTATLLEVLRSRDAEESCRYLDRMRRKEPGNTFWTRQALLIGLSEGRHEWLAAWLDSVEGLSAPVECALRGDLAFAREEWAGAAAFYERAVRSLPLVTWSMRRGEALYRAGDVEAALSLWDAALLERPWLINLVLRVDGVRRGHDRPGDVPAGRGAVLLYTWNKADCLPETLEALAGSALGDALVIVLDNGSSDATPQVLDSFRSRLGERLMTVTLPCNVGAPAARNWLLTLPEVRACDWLVFLDDDAVVPNDWLRLFGTAMQHYPEHGVYGCRVVDHAVPMVLQSVDLHLETGGPSGPEGGPLPVYQRHFRVSDLHHQELDFGLFSYLRPCVSVTGCCHLFRREAIDRCGAFDVRFSPSQYDDLEHDIRHALAGDLPVYQGNLRVRHMKRSGRMSLGDPAQLYSSWANLFKLEKRYTAEQYAAVRELENRALLADYRKRVGLQP